MYNTERLRDTYNALADAWCEENDDGGWERGGIATFIEHVQPNGHVLDVGCGSGVKARLLTDAGLRVTGIDFAERMTQLARDRVPSATFYTMDMHTAPEAFAGMKFDAVFMQAVLLHVPRADAAELIRTYASLIQPTGSLYIATKLAEEGRPYEEVVKEELYGRVHERFFSYFTADELEKYVSEAGCTITYAKRCDSESSTWLQLIGEKKE